MNNIAQLAKDSRLTPFLGLMGGSQTQDFKNLVSKMLERAQSHSQEAYSHVVSEEDQSCHSSSSEGLLKEIEKDFHQCFSNVDKKRIFPAQDVRTNYQNEIGRLSGHVGYIQKQIRQVSDEKQVLETKIHCS